MAKQITGQVFPDWGIYFWWHWVTSS